MGIGHLFLLTSPSPISTRTTPGAKITSPTCSENLCLYLHVSLRRTKCNNSTSSFLWSIKSRWLLFRLPRHPLRLPLHLILNVKTPPSTSPSTAKLNSSSHSSASAAQQFVGRRKRLRSFVIQCEMSSPVVAF